MEGRNVCCHGDKLSWNSLSKEMFTSVLAEGVNTC